jgi:hypothetical protein
MSKHIPGQLGHDNLELTKAVAASTFLKTIESVVFCFHDWSEKPQFGQIVRRTGDSAGEGERQVTSQ